MKEFRPLLAAAIKNVEDINFPVLASPKLDGVRCLIKDGQAVSHSLKPIPNAHIREHLSHSDGNGLDGELVVGEPTSPNCFSITQSAVMSKLGTPAFTYYVFDLHNFRKPFEERLAKLAKYESKYTVKILPHYLVENVDQLLNLETHWLAQGFEGVMVRDPHGIYKHGRSTLKQGILLKLKRFVDSEAQVVGYEELQHNENKATTDELGHTKRTSHKAGQVAGGTLGALVVKDLETGIQFNIGSGFTQAERLHIWNNRDTIVGKLLKYKSFYVGVKEKPRFPTWLGWRDIRDMS